MNFLTRSYPAEVLHPEEIISAPALRVPIDHHVLIEGIREGVPTAQDLVVVAQALISSGAQRAGGRKTAVVEVEEPGFFFSRVRVAARVTAELEVWVRGRR